MSNDERTASATLANLAQIILDEAEPLPDCREKDRIQKAARTLLSQSERTDPIAKVLRQIDGDTPSSIERPGPQASYVPLTNEEIEQRRAQFLAAHQEPFASGTRRAINALCDMAINSTLYAEEIHRLRDTPSAIRYCDCGKVSAEVCSRGYAARHPDCIHETGRARS